jgi:hypothetical protein
MPSWGAVIWGIAASAVLAVAAATRAAKDTVTPYGLPVSQYENSAAVSRLVPAILAFTQT